MMIMVVVSDDDGDNWWLVFMLIMMMVTIMFMFNVYVLVSLLCYVVFVVEVAKYVDKVV